VSRGRKEKRHACNVIRTCSNAKMERSCASAPPPREPENIEAAGEAKEGETNASDPLAALEVAGAQETNVPEERSAAVRRDGEPQTSAAKKWWQKEAAADGHRAATGEQPP
jgi:hypothetical protein